MKKINKKSGNEKVIITCHDNLLSDIYFLSSHTIKYEEINGIPYLINSSKGRGYQVGLRTVIPSSLLEVDGITKKFTELSTEEQNKIINSLKEKLLFTDIEILFTNILLDRYLSSTYNFDISFKEIESDYRKKAISTRNIVINDYTYKRYIFTLNSLKEKEVFLKTSSKFRQHRYGVNNRNFNHKFLTVIHDYKIGTNNVGFSYSFGEFGRVLKLSRRYSTSMPAADYRCNFNQVAFHCVSFVLAQKFFIHNHNAILSNRYGDYELTISIDEILNLIPYRGRKKDTEGLSYNQVLKECKQQPNKNRIYRKAISYLESLLSAYKSNGTICDYELNYYVDETEEFARKHEYDVWASDTRDYILSDSDIGQYLVYTTVTIIL